MNYLKHTITSDFMPGTRIDQYIADELKLFSRSQAKLRIGKISVNGKEVKPSFKIALNDCIELYYNDPPSNELKPEKIGLSILFENDQVIVIDKKQGMVVHPGCGNTEGTLVNAILYHCSRIKENFIAPGVNPGIVHRLDKDTSGVIIVAKDVKTHEYLSRQFALSRIKKIYLAITSSGPPEQFGIIETFLKRDPHNRKKFQVSEKEGRKAITRYKLLRSHHGYSFLLLRPRTGRTHQLRVHLKYLNTPIIGDPVYGKKDKRFPDATLMLHAFRLTIRLPGEKTKRTFEAPIPARFKEMLKAIRTKS